MNLDSIRAQLGQPKRKLGWFKSSPLAFPEPSWLADPAMKANRLKDLFPAFNSLWKNGVVVWGYIVRARRGLFSPGENDLSGIMIFSATAADETAIKALPSLGNRLNRNADAIEPDPTWNDREKRWWLLIADDDSYQRGYRVPVEWQTEETDYVGSTVLFHRKHLPGGVIQSCLMPVLFDPTSGLAQIIPCRYWPDGMAEWLAREYGMEPVSLWPALDSLVEYPVPRETREALYQDVFGPIVSVFHELIPSPHHIDVYHFKWDSPRHEHGYVTGGMSDAKQPERDDFARIELVFYSKKHLPGYPELVRIFAHYPWQSGSAISQCDTIPLGPLADLLLGSARFTALFFVPGVSVAETGIRNRPEFTEPDIRVLSVLPITQAELELTFTDGFPALLELMKKNHFDFAFDPDRPCLVRP